MSDEPVAEQGGPVKSPEDKDNPQDRYEKVRGLVLDIAWTIDNDEVAIGHPTNIWEPIEAELRALLEEVGVFMPERVPGAQTVPWGRKAQNAADEGGGSTG